MKAILWLGILGGAVLVSCQSSRMTEPASTSAQLFKGPVSDLFERRCAECHNSDIKPAGLSVLDRELVFKGDALGPFVVPGDLEKSRLWKAISAPQSHPRMMPADGWQLSERHRTGVRDWIKTGAYWPEGRAGNLKRKKYFVELEDQL